MFTRDAQPGRFEGNGSQLLARIVHEASLGDPHAERGDMLEQGRRYRLVLGRRYGFIVTEDSMDFVDVEICRTHEEAERRFEGIEDVDEELRTEETA